MSGPLRTEVTIDAPPRRVWEALTDLDSFAAWNPFIRHAKGRLAPGERLDLVLRLGGRDLRLRPTITRVEPERELRWLARQALPGLFDVERRFALEPAGRGRTRFVQSESGSGLLAPLLMRLLRGRILDGYEKLNAALAARTEASTNASTVAAAVPPNDDKGTLMRKLTLLGLGLGVGTIAARRLRNGKPERKQSEWRERISSHETFVHDSIDSLGYDWSRVGNPHAPPRHPRKIYVPQSTEDIVAAIDEVRELGEDLRIRSKGHSSNDLVLSDGGSVLVTEKLNRVLEIDEDNMTATVQAGAISAEVDDVLAERELGLPIIGDHNHITVGGFASVGGISPASHRFGMFVDNVVSFTYVDWDGNVHTCSRDDNRADFYKVLGGLGRYGVMSTMTLRIMRVDKYGTVLENHQTHYREVEDFIAGAGQLIRDPGDALMERGVWIDFPLSGGRSVGFGQFSAYHETDQTAYAQVRDEMSYGYLHGMGYAAGRLPDTLDKWLKYVGIAGVVFSPKYATMKNVEFFTDKILDSTVGDPTRMFIALAPINRFEDLFRATYDLMREFRTRDEAFSFISVYVKSIKSEYLAQGSDDNHFCELMVYCGIRPENLTDTVLEDLARRFDDLVISHDGFRYMHSRTARDPERERQVDPNVYWAEQAGETPRTIAEQVSTHVVTVPERAAEAHEQETSSEGRS